MAHKSFAQKSTDDTELEAITFDLSSETDIACRPSVNGKLLIEIVGKVDSPSVAKQAEGIIDVFDICVRTDDGDDAESYTGKRFDKHTDRQLEDAAEADLEPGVDPTSSLGRLTSVLDDPNTDIKVEVLAELVGWLVESYTARPNQNAAVSGSGTKSTRGTSRRTRRAPGGTGAALTSVPPTT